MKFGSENITPITPTFQFSPVNLTTLGATAYAYREDLVHYPDNGWSLRGLALAQKKQGRQVASLETEQRMRTAFRGADAVPASSRF